MAERTAGKQGGRPFKKGQSGNPQGRPKGALNKATRVAQALLDGEAENLARKAVELAKSGNVVALRLCLERLLPPRRERPVSFHPPTIEGARDIPSALSSILDAVAKGELTPGEGQALASTIESYRRALEITDLASRIETVESLLNDKMKKGSY